MKKILWSLVIGLLVIGGVASAAAIVDVEFDAGISRAFTAGMTQYDNQSDYRPFDTLTREQGAKMFSVFAMKNLCIAPDSSVECTFSDMESADPTLKAYLTTSCQLGLFKGSEGKFMPKAPLTKAQALTVLIRAIDGKQDETQTPRRSIYFEKARQHGLTKETNAMNLDKSLSRYEALLMQYRARQTDCTNGGGYSDDLLKALSELFGEDTVPMNDTGSLTVSGEVTLSGEVNVDLTCSNDCSDHSFDVSVATKDATHPAQGGSSMGFVIDGVQGKKLVLQRGETYTFNVQTPEIHTLYISTDSVGAGNGVYSAGVENAMISSGIITWIVDANAPDLLYYECGNHPMMGRQIEIVDSCSCE